MTGASSGIGEAFARALAARSMNLLLTALPGDQDLLEGIARELSSTHGVKTAVVTIDLAAVGAPSTLQEAANARIDPTCW